MAHATCASSHWPTHLLPLLAAMSCAYLFAYLPYPFCQDTIQTFYEITQKESKDYSMAIMAKDREMEIMEDNHRVEVRVYVQKVKHLEYEHKNTLGRVESKVGPYALLRQHTHAHVSLVASLLWLPVGAPLAAINHHHRHSPAFRSQHSGYPCTDQNDTVRGG